MNSLRDAPRDVLDDADARAWARGWTVFVDGYTVAARIGLYPHEHLAPQPIVIDARLGCLGEPDEDGVWIDYDGFCARVAAFLAGRPHTRLLETLVADLAALSFQTWPALGALTLAVHKPGIRPDARRVGVALAWTRDDYLRWCAGRDKSGMRGRRSLLRAESQGLMSGLNRMRFRPRQNPHVFTCGVLAHHAGNS